MTIPINTHLLLLNNQDQLQNINKYSNLPCVATPGTSYQTSPARLLDTTNEINRVFSSFLELLVSTWASFLDEYGAPHCDLLRVFLRYHFRVYFIWDARNVLITCSARPLALRVAAEAAKIAEDSLAVDLRYVGPCVTAPLFNYTFHATCLSSAIAP